MKVELFKHIVKRLACNSYHWTPSYLISEGTIPVLGSSMHIYNPSTMSTPSTDSHNDFPDSDHGKHLRHHTPNVRQIALVLILNGHNGSCRFSVAVGMISNAFDVFYCKISACLRGGIGRLTGNSWTSGLRVPRSYSEYWPPGWSWAQGGDLRDARLIPVSFYSWP